MDMVSSLLTVVAPLALANERLDVDALERQTMEYAN